MIILIDNGHGRNTPGKCSPDRRLLEWKYTREIADDLVGALRARGIDARRIVTEDTDVSLAERCRRVNAVCSEHGTANVLLVSIHCNAAGMGTQWLSARGWSAFVCPTASARSRRLAETLFDAARAQSLTTRQPAPAQKYWTMNLAICRGTRCPAVLTENLFQDNRDDVDFLLSPQGRAAIVALHADAITAYINP